MIRKRLLLLILLISILNAGCVRPSKPFDDVWSPSASTSVPPINDQSTMVLPTPTNLIRQVGDSINTPTPDEEHLLPTPRSDAETYVVQSGDALGKIAKRYGVTLEMILKENDIVDPDALEVGQSLVIPAPQKATPGMGNKIIPNSELVYGPRTVDFDTFGFVKEKQGYLMKYRQEIDGERMGGAAIVQRVAQEYSVNPRLLLAVLEYQSGWLTQEEPAKKTLDYPMGVQDQWRHGLYNQLAWAADQLNRGYYLWRVNGVGTWVLTDGSSVAINPRINAGTAGIQSLFAGLYGRSGWDRATSEEGLFKTFFELFGYPFDYAIEPILPADLTQPKMQLPFEPGLLWAFTGGPHGGWGSGSAWAGLDFAPPGEPMGCVESEAWVVAAADGLIVRSDRGAVVQDLDGDGQEQTGWTMLYMHIEGDGRVEAGTYLQAGDRIGHPSCEGGYSTGTHVHIARRYNGEWIPADQQLPFVLDGWISRGAGYEYNGYLVREGKTIEAWEGYYPENQIQR